MADKIERLFWTDLARVLAVFGVVIVHVAADVITEWDRFPVSWWWAALLP
jgi:surface polysaccharide O-acyltransferase-like enzyme